MNRKRHLYKFCWHTYNDSDQDSDLKNFIWLVELIHQLRPDLCQLFPLNKSARSLKFIAWLLRNGNRNHEVTIDDLKFFRMLSYKLSGFELTPLQALIYLKREDIRKIYPLPEYINDFISWFYSHGIIEHELISYLTNEELQKISDQGIPYLKKNVQDYSFQSRQRCLFGVNLIGYPFGKQGIRKEVRLIAHNMLKIGIPFSIFSFSSPLDSLQKDINIGKYVTKRGKYAINIFCMTALEIIHSFIEKKSDQFIGRYNIGYLPWEVGEWSSKWMDLFRIVDEIWVSNRYTYDTVAPLSPVPVLIMPSAIELEPVSELRREDFGLPLGAYLFYFSLDLSAPSIRKNFQASIKAFLKVAPRKGPFFKGRDDVGLVIKVHKAKNRHYEWEELKALAKFNDHIYVIEKTLSRPDMLGLCKCCDCFLNLYGDEDFGRGITEALLLGLRVITTGYSKNVYLRKHPRVEYLRCGSGVIPMQTGRYPISRGRKKVDIDWLQAAASMRRVAANGHSLSAAGSSQDLFSPRPIGQKYSDRLQWLFKTLLHSSAVAMEKTA